MSKIYKGGKKNFDLGVGGGDDGGKEGGGGDRVIFTMKRH